MKQKMIRCIGGHFDGKMMPYDDQPYAQYIDQSESTRCEPFKNEDPKPIADLVKEDTYRRLSCTMKHKYRKSSCIMFGRRFPIMLSDSESADGIQSEFLDDIIAFIARGGSHD